MRRVEGRRVGERIRGAEITTSTACAQDKATGKAHNITIQASGGLDETEIERMVKEGEDNAEQDKIKKESVEVKNQAESGEILTTHHHDLQAEVKVL